MQVLQFDVQERQVTGVRLAAAAVFAVEVLVKRVEACWATYPDAHWKQVEVEEHTLQLPGQGEQVLPFRN